MNRIQYLFRDVRLRCSKHTLHLVYSAPPHPVLYLIPVRTKPERLNEPDPVREHVTQPPPRVRVVTPSLPSPPAAEVSGLRLRRRHRHGQQRGRRHGRQRPVPTDVRPLQTGPGRRPGHTVENALHVPQIWR